MNCVMDCIQVCSLCSLCQVGLAGSCAVLCSNSQLQVLLGAVGNNIAQQLCKLCCVLCFFVSSLLIVHANFRIAFSVSHSCHCQIHTNLGTFTFEVRFQICQDIFAYALCNANYVLSCPAHFVILFCKLIAANVAYRTFFRRLISLVNVSAYLTYPFTHNSYLSFMNLFQTILYSKGLLYFSCTVSIIVSALEVNPSFEYFTECSYWIPKVFL